tara:strand:- start:126 stop:557 length:432 start_codon:yes stop_codon:yes gene_type:complete
MVDMEGSGFFQTVSKISSHELILVIKIVSDNSKNKIDDINSNIIENLFKNSFALIEECILKYINLSQEECRRKKLPTEFYKLISSYNFTVSQKHLLKDLIKKWITIFPKNTLDEITIACKDSKSVIDKLRKLIDENVVDWGKN